MTNNLLQLKIKQRLNKLASMDYDNIECWQVQEAVNKAQLEWARRQLHGGNQYKEGAEQSITRIDDLQVLLATEPLKGKQQDNYFESELLPSAYMRFARVSTEAKSECCAERKMTVYLGEEANADNLYTDKLSDPSFEWAETYCTIFSNRIRIYTKDFTLVNPKLVYYQKPKEILFKNCSNPSTGETTITEQECVFKDDIVELIIDETCAILAGDIESINQFQRGTQAAERNN